MANSKITDFRIIRGFNDMTTLGCKPEKKIGERGIKIDTFDCAVLLLKKE